jgi:Holliday junction resolvase RusA-like endonuclease
MTPHKLLNPNNPVKEKDRRELPWPLPKKSAVVIKFAFRRELRNVTSLAGLQRPPEEPLLGPVVLRFTVAWEKGRQFVDWDNCCSMLKGCLDGLVDAGYMFDDDQVTGIFIEQIKDPAGLGYIDVTVEPDVAREAA